MPKTQLQTAPLGATGLEITRARFGEPELSRHLGQVERLLAVAERYDTTPVAVAVAWTLRNPAVDGAIVGFRRPDQVDPILAAGAIDLTAEDVEQIEGEAR